MSSYNFVPKFYTMDPETEEFLSDGKKLENGMVVLIASSNLRVNVDKALEDWELDRALQRNRWAKISDLEFRTYVGDELLSFVATYENGTKRKWESIGVQRAWYVKRDSIPNPSAAWEKKYMEVFELVANAMLDHEREVNVVADETARKILEIH